MPDLDANDIEDLEPSADPNLDENANAAEPAEHDDANSSAATGENEDESLLSVVRDVVKDRKQPEASTASPAKGEEDTSQEDDEPKKQDDEDYSDVPFHKHPRFQHLLRKSKAFEQDAVRYRNVVDFLDNSGLSSEEAADGLSIMGLAKTNPAEAWKRIKPWVQKVLVASGEILPDDLKARVQNGEMSQEAAIEVSRSRATAESVRAEQSFRQQQEERRRHAEGVRALGSAAATWEQDRRLKDPNFDAKLEPLQKEIAYLQMKEGKPTTPDGVRDQLRRAYKAVNDALKPAAPSPAARPAVRPVTGGQVAGNQQPEAQSTLDIIRARRRTA